MQVSVLSGQKRGIYLREPHQIGKLIRASVSVKPKFRETAGKYMFVVMYGDGLVVHRLN